MPQTAGNETLSDGAYEANRVTTTRETTTSSPISQIVETTSNEHPTSFLIFGATKGLAGLATFPDAELFSEVAVNV